MKKLMVILVLFGMIVSMSSANATIKYVSSYTRSDGTSVSGHYKDTSGDGNPYNNANYLGLNN